MTDNIVIGWPDAIKCSAYGGWSIFILQAGSEDGGAGYRQVYSPENRYVSFNLGGIYDSRGGDDLSSASCQGLSIQQLRNAGQAFNFVRLNVQDNSGQTSMISGSPDAIKCSSYGGWSIFILQAGSEDGGAGYREVYSPEDRYVGFNSGDAYGSRGGDDLSSASCQGLSVQQLYNMGQAFNFVTSKMPDSTGQTSIIAGWPDAIKCSIYGAWSVYIIHWAGNVPGAYSFYRQVYSPEDRYINFNADGTYHGRGGDDLFSASCQGLSIQQLYNAGQAFNFVTSQIISSSPIGTGTFSVSETMSITKTSSISSAFSVSHSLTATAVPSASSSVSPSIDCSINIVKELTGIDLIIYHGTCQDETFIINEQNVVIYGEGGIDKFVIVPRADSNVTLADFINGEKVDLSNFKYIKSFNDLEFRTDSRVTTINLPDMQKIMFYEQEVTSDNFIFAAADFPWYVIPSITISIVVAVSIVGAVTYYRTTHPTVVAVQPPSQHVIVLNQMPYMMHTKIEGVVEICGEVTMASTEE